MNEKTLLAKTRVDDGLIQVMSPMVGRIELCVALKEEVLGGHCIGHLWRLTKRFTLKLPDDCTGFITDIAGQGGLISSEYGQYLLALDPQKTKPRGHPNAAEKTPEKALYITSPMDGLMYLSPAADQPPFVTVGQKILPGQTIGLIEVMKSFYPVKYQGDTPAIVTAIMINPATPVQSGAKLFAIKI